MQSHELYSSQHYATSIYRAELASRLQDLGYEIESGKYGQPEIKGYTKEYLEASSPGGSALTRDRKDLLSPAEVLQQHRDLAAQ